MQGLQMSRLVPSIEACADVLPQIHARHPDRAPALTPPTQQGHQQKHNEPTHRHHQHRKALRTKRYDRGHHQCHERNDTQSLADHTALCGGFIVTQCEQRNAVHHQCDVHNHDSDKHLPHSTRPFVSTE